jgi:hypothetical protein
LEGGSGAARFSATVVHSARKQQAVVADVVESDVESAAILGVARWQHLRIERGVQGDDVELSRQAVAGPQLR